MGEAAVAIGAVQAVQAQQRHQYIGIGQHAAHRARQGQAPADALRPDGRGQRERGCEMQVGGHRDSGAQALCGSTPGLAGTGSGRITLYQSSRRVATMMAASTPNSSSEPIISALSSDTRMP